VILVKGEFFADVTEDKMFILSPDEQEGLFECKRQ
jgi:hypothetical protein